MITIELNLAARPVRNRRLYVFLSGLLLAVTAAAIILAAFFTLQYSGRIGSLKSRLAGMEGRIATAEREERQLSIKTREAARRHQDNVDLVNTLIARKAFCWTDFLSRLEEAMPASSYVLALDQQKGPGEKSRFRFRLASRSLEDLLVLITNLQSRRFSQIRVESEEKNAQGQLVYEITVSYEQGEENSE